MNGLSLAIGNGVVVPLWQEVFKMIIDVDCVKRKEGGH